MFSLFASFIFSFYPHTAAHGYTKLSTISTAYRAAVPRTTPRTPQNSLSVPFPSLDSFVSLLLFRPKRHPTTTASYSGSTGAIPPLLTLRTLAQSLSTVAAKRRRRRHHRWNTAHLHNRTHCAAVRCRLVGLRANAPTTAVAVFSVDQFFVEFTHSLHYLFPVRCCYIIFCSASGLLHSVVATKLYALVLVWCLGTLLCIQKRIASKLRADAAAKRHISPHHQFQSTCKRDMRLRNAPQTIHFLSQRSAHWEIIEICPLVRFCISVGVYEKLFILRFHPVPRPF